MKELPANNAYVLIWKGGSNGVLIASSRAAMLNIISDTYSPSDRDDVPAHFADTDNWERTHDDTPAECTFEIVSETRYGATRHRLTVHRVRDLEGG